MTKMLTNGDPDTIKSILKHGVSVLKQSRAESPVADAAILLSDVMGLDRALLYANPDMNVASKGIEKFLQNLGMRSAGMPLAYIIGHKEFMSLDFEVSGDVLIPRPETELLVETVTALSGNRVISILDIGTGSGCIAVSLAKMIDSASITASDISEKALAIARRNAQKNGVSGRITFICSDLFSKLDGRMFDIVVSNPPYVPSGDIALLQREISGFEPVPALDGGSDGLDYYRRISAQAPPHIVPGGVLVLEIGINQSVEVTGILKSSAGVFDRIVVEKDHSGIERMLCGFMREA